MSVKLDPIFKLGSEVLRREKIVPKLRPQSLEIWGTKLKPTPREPPMKIEISKLGPEVLFKKNPSTLAVWPLMSVSWTNDQMLSVSHPYYICPNLCCWHYISDWKLHFRVIERKSWKHTQHGHFHNSHTLVPCVFNHVLMDFVIPMCLLFHEVFKFTFLFSSIALKNK